VLINFLSVSFFFSAHITYKSAKAEELSRQITNSLQGAVPLHASNWHPIYFSVTKTKDSLSPHPCSLYYLRAHFSHSRSQWGDGRFLIYNQSSVLIGHGYITGI